MPAELTATLAVLADVLDIRTVSRFYPDRPPSPTKRVYLDAVPYERHGSYMDRPPTTHIRAPLGAVICSADKEAE